MADMTKVLVFAGGAAAIAGVVCFLMKDSVVASRGRARGSDKEEKNKGPVDVKDITKDQVQEILTQIISSQEQMKGYMKGLTKELLTRSLNFEQTYNKVKEVQPLDPLEQHGLSLMDFDELLDKHQGDPNIRDAIKRIMGAPSPNSVASDKVLAIDVKKIIAVHNFMLEELDKLVAEFQALPNKESFDVRTVTIVVQAIIGAKIEHKYSITSEDIEAAVLAYHTMLATDSEFAAINIKISHTMGKLMGTPFEMDGSR